VSDEDIPSYEYSETTETKFEISSPQIDDEAIDTETYKISKPFRTVIKARIVK